MGWAGPVLTDSGGYQVFSLAALRTIREEGVRFRTHLDGHEEFVTPERAVEIQAQLDSTITMCFDECTPFPSAHSAAAASMRLSMRWAARSLQSWPVRPGYGIFGIIQGSVYP